ncbi:MAG: TetR/AcrR family transcriptional regulator C-terminal domain-containing protein [Pseudolysinimonas sp.]|uniref:TetR/AcrR family transcriptional regulator n=1 Tax=Pseudolysinimonas sp. TaxID=2680009 RepID=UPI003267867E
MPTSGSAPTTREPLSRPRVIAAAVALADREGLEGISMRRVGRELGVEAMSLYRYVSSKDDLIDAMVDQVIGEFPAPDEALDWNERLRTLVLGAYLVLLDHGWAASPATSRPSAGPARLSYVDAILGALLDGGCSHQLAHDALHGIDSHVFGFTLQEFRLESGVSGRGYELDAIVAGGDPEVYPNIARVIGDAHHDRDQEFVFVLDVLISGIERAIAGSPRTI